jgi:hypothetical protein
LLFAFLFTSFLLLDFGETLWCDTNVNIVGRGASDTTITFSPASQNNVPVIHVAANHLYLEGVGLSHRCTGYDIWHGNAVIQVEKKVTERPPIAARSAAADVGSVIYRGAQMGLARVTAVLAASFEGRAPTGAAEAQPRIVDPSCNSSSSSSSSSSSAPTGAMMNPLHSQQGGAISRCSSSSSSSSSSDDAFSSSSSAASSRSSANYAGNFSSNHNLDNVMQGMEVTTSAPAPTVVVVEKPKMPKLTIVNCIMTSETGRGLVVMEGGSAKAMNCLIHNCGVSELIIHN